MVLKVTKHPHESDNNSACQVLRWAEKCQQARPNWASSHWRSNQQSNSRSLSDGSIHQGNKHYCVFGESIKLIETEKSSSILSFNWKEEKLLKKKLSFLESMKKYEANAWLMEQKAFYKRCYAKFQRSELTLARLLGDKELVKQITSKNMFPNYSTTLVDETEAAVKAIIKNKGGTEFSLYPALRSEPLNKVEAQEASWVTLKADFKKAGMKATLKKRSPSRWERKPGLLLSLQSLESPQKGQQQKQLSVESSIPPWKGERMLRNFSSRLSSTVQGDLPGSATGRKSKDKLLKYIIHGERSMEDPKKKRPRPRNNLNGLQYVQMDPLLLVSGGEIHKCPMAHTFPLP
jgi:hypothetical protein